MVLTEGQMSDHKGAGLLIEKLPDAKILIGDRGYESKWFGYSKPKTFCPAFPRQEAAKRYCLMTKDYPNPPQDRGPLRKA